jgi:hypothetical protein
MRPIIGVQLHHSVNLEDASRFGINMLTALEATLKRTDDPEIRQLLERLGPLVREIGVARTAAGLRLQMHQRDPEFKRYVNGELPWPDELQAGFVPRCSCEDRCLYHDVGRGSLEQDCNCDSVCGLHGYAEAA